MIKFFRKFRRDLLTENKFIKYLIYAIGEIILVMVGILLALQVNNWNEGNKRKVLEVNILQDIKIDIEENVNNLKKGIRVLEYCNEGMSQVILAYEQKKPYNDSMLIDYSRFIGWWNPDFTYASFENLKNVGVNIISNPVLRRDIINLIEVDMNILDVAEANRINQINSSMILPLIKDYFYRDLSVKNYSYMPNNYEVMINDPRFYNICTEFSFRQKSSINRYQVFNQKARNLISRINSEIQKLK